MQIHETVSNCLRLQGLCFFPVPNFPTQWRIPPHWYTPRGVYIHIHAMYICNVHFRRSICVYCGVNSVYARSICKGLQHYTLTHIGQGGGNFRGEDFNSRYLHWKIFISTHIVWGTIRCSLSMITQYQFIWFLRAEGTTRLYWNQW